MKIFVDDSLARFKAKATHFIILTWELWAWLITCGIPRVMIHTDQCTLHTRQTHLISRERHTYGRSSILIW